MSDRVIEQADLRTIEHNLGAIHNDLQTLDSNVGAVNSNIKVVYDEIGSLAKEFHDFVSVQQRANRLNQAETRLVKIRQELEKKYGHYDIVRRTTTGILQADDIGIVKKDTISNGLHLVLLHLRHGSTISRNLQRKPLKKASNATMKRHHCFLH